MSGSKGPRIPASITCFICGRPYQPSSIGIHVKSCAKLWQEIENKKPRGQRRPLPQAPPGFGSITGVSGGFDDHSYDGAHPAIGIDYDAYNEAAAESYKQGGLVPCEYCGRRFAPERLEIHNRSCTPESPARPVGAPLPGGGGGPASGAVVSPPPVAAVRSPSRGAGSGHGQSLAPQYESMLSSSSSAYNANGNGGVSVFTPKGEKAHVLITPPSRSSSPSRSGATRPQSSGLVRPSSNAGAGAGGDFVYPRSAEQRGATVGTLLRGSISSKQQQRQSIGEAESRAEADSRDRGATAVLDILRQSLEAAGVTDNAALNAAVAALSSSREAASAYLTQADTSPYSPRMLASPTHDRMGRDREQAGEEGSPASPVRASLMAASGRSSRTGAAMGDTSLSRSRGSRAAGQMSPEASSYLTSATGSASGRRSGASPAATTVALGQSAGRTVDRWGNAPLPSLETLAGNLDLTDVSQLSSAATDIVISSLAKAFPAPGSGDAADVDGGSGAAMPDGAAFLSVHDKSSHLTRLLAHQDRVRALRRDIDKGLESLELEIARTVRALLIQAPSHGMQ